MLKEILLAIVVVLALAVLGNANTATTANNANKLGNKDASSYVLKDNFIEINGEITLNNGSGHTTIDYPAGANRENLRVLSVAIDLVGYDSYFSNSGMHMFSVDLTDVNITIKCSAVEEIGSTGTKNFKVMLIKVK